jgi:hypothetical protein
MFLFTSEPHNLNHRTSRHEQFRLISFGRIPSRCGTGLHLEATAPAAADDDGRNHHHNHNHMHTCIENLEDVKVFIIGNKNNYSLVMYFIKIC